MNRDPIYACACAIFSPFVLGWTFTQLELSATAICVAGGLHGLALLLALSMVERGRVD